jgi:hypothetical protein
LGVVCQAGIFSERVLKSMMRVIMRVWMGGVRFEAKVELVILHVREMGNGQLTFFVLRAEVCCFQVGSVLSVPHFD